MVFYQPDKATAIDAGIMAIGSNRFYGRKITVFWDYLQSNGHFLR